ncbi:MAG: hypothetical protein MUF12_10145, partial [Sediminibacterium sp.]|nr:hypothetical protein [Sediminibacterium sp.]
FEASAPKNSLYVEFDVPAGVSIIRGSGDGWGLFFSPNNSPHYGFYKSKGLNTVQPSISNIEIVKTK